MNQAVNLKFDSVILAGGFGRRLAPLTDKLPKPLLPIAGESAYVRNLKLLRKNGFVNTAVTTMYLSEQIESAVFDEGVVTCFREETPLGSAGAVGQLKDKIGDCIIVMSGDAICDFDLKSAKERFTDSKAQAAMILCRTKEAGEYGSVCVDNGIVTAISEKPSPRDTMSDRINTGIYFLSKEALELIPEKGFFDFAADLFPEMLRRNMVIIGIEPEGKWFDIGSFGDYHQCNMWISRGENCIGKQVSVHPEARIESSVIFDNCTIGNSILRGCIIAEGCIIGNDCMIPSGCVIGSGAELRDGSVLAPGTIVDSKETVTGRAYNDYFPKPKQKLILDDDFVIADDSDEGYFVRLGRLLGGEGSVVAYAEGSGMTLQQACELACGAAKAGSSCTVISGGNAALAAFAALEYESRCAYIYIADGQTEIRLFSQRGMPFSREELREISAKKPENSKITGNVYLLPHGALIKKYIAHVKKQALIPKKMTVGGGRSEKLLREICEELGITTDGDAHFRLTADGERAYVMNPDGREISYWQLLTICCIEGGKKEIFLPRDTPDTVEKILNRHWVKTRFYGDSRSEERMGAEKEFLHRDGVILALTAAALAEQKGFDLESLARRIPQFSVITRVIYADRDNMYSVISGLRESGNNPRHAGFDFGEGRVNVYASASGRYRLVAEALDSETAEEISLRAIDLLTKD